MPTIERSPHILMLNIQATTQANFDPSNPPHLTAVFPLIINGRKINALLDTGSHISLLRKSVAEEIGAKFELISPVLAKGITGHECELKGITYCNLRVGDHKFKQQPFHIIDECAYECLIGLDVLTEFGYMTVNFSNKELILHARPPRVKRPVIPFRHVPVQHHSPTGDFDPPREVESFPVTVCDRLLLPPRSHVVCSLQVQCPNMREMCFTPNQSFLTTHEVWAAHSISTIKKHNLLVMILNPSLNTKIIPSGTEVGKAKPFVITKFPCQCPSSTKCPSSTQQKEGVSVLATIINNKSHKTEQKLGELAASNFDTNTVVEDPSINLLSAPIRKVEPDSETIEDKIWNLDFTNSALTKGEQIYFKKFLLKNKQVFAVHSADLGSYKGYEHTINTSDHPPISQRPYRVPYALKEEVRRQITELVDNNILEPTHSPWASPVLLVKKPDGTLRLCCDFRKLNAITTYSVFPLPNMESILDQLSNAKYYTTMDMQSGFWQLPMAKQDQAKTAIVTEEGQYKWLRMPMGLSGAPSSYQCAMNQVLAGLQPQTALIYIDDLICRSSTFAGHLEDLQKVFDRFIEVGLKIKLKKCVWASPSVSFLGVTVSAKGIECDLSKVAAVREMKAPTDIKGLRRFLGMCGYHRRHIPDFAILAKPLFSLLKKDKSYEWTHTCQLAFTSLKEKLCTAPVLAFPDPKKPYILETDGSLQGLGACLSQKQEDGTVRPLTYVSRTLSSGEKSYTSSELECAAVIYALKKFRHYCLGSQVLCITDNSAVSYIMRTKTPSGRLARWSLLLQDFNIEFKHRPGTENHVADCLSRAPINLVSVRPDALMLPNKQQMVDAQHRDNMYLPMITFLTTGVVDQDPQLAKKIEKESANFLMFNGLLYFRNADNIRRMVVPKEYIPTILFAYHDSIFSNHPGVVKTQENIARKYYWPTLNKDVTQYVKDCQQCARRKPLTRSMEPKAGTLIANHPYDLVSMDLQELPETPRGFKYILVIVDFFTHYMEAIPLKNKTAATTAEAFMTEWVSRHGVPETVLTDNALNFTAPDLVNLYRRLNIRPMTTAPYSPNQNGRVEKMNHLIQEVLAMLTDPMTQNDWDKQLPYALISLRNRTNETTGFTPFYMLHGFDMTIPTERALSFDAPTTQVDADTYIDEIQTRMQHAWALAHKNAQKHAEKRREKHDNRKRTHSAQVGDIVLLRKMRKPGPLMKLGDRFSAPHIVRKLKGGNMWVTPQNNPEAPLWPVHQRNTKFLCKARADTPPPPPLSESQKVTPAMIDPNLEEELSEDDDIE